MWTKRPGRSSGFVIAIVFAFGLMATVSAAQTYTVIHTFTGGPDGGNPFSGLTMDRSGNLYGTTYTGGDTNASCDGLPGCGTVFQLHPSSGGWITRPLYQFEGDPSDGGMPKARVVFGPDGSLYGTTSGGGLHLAGTVFKLTPSATFCATVSCLWTETLLYQFTGLSNRNSPDGNEPGSGDLVFDGAGNLYGATLFGGALGLRDNTTCGTVYELSPAQGGWAESILYYFVGWNDGAYPNGVVLDPSGNLYGTTSQDGSSGSGSGTVFKLIRSSGRWSEVTLFKFLNGIDGGGPIGVPVLDPLGDLWGSTSYSGSGGGGTVFELSSSGGASQLTTLYSFIYPGGGYVGPTSSLTMDAQGNLYGVTYADGEYGWGAVFKLTNVGGTWTYTSLHDFTAGSDGGKPYGQVVLDANGNVFGTATIGGSAVGTCENGQGCGVVWEITP